MIDWICEVLGHPRLTPTGHTFACYCGLNSGLTGTMGTVEIHDRRRPDVRALERTR